MNLNEDFIFNIPLWTKRKGTILNLRPNLTLFSQIYTPFYCCGCSKLVSICCIMLHYVSLQAYNWVHYSTNIFFSFISCSELLIDFHYGLAICWSSFWKSKCSILLSVLLPVCLSFCIICRYLVYWCMVRTRFLKFVYMFFIKVYQFFLSHFYSIIDWAVIIIQTLPSVQIKKRITKYFMQLMYEVCKTLFLYKFQYGDFMGQALKTIKYILFVFALFICQRRVLRFMYSGCM